jgi:hypothetical protein
MMRHSSSVCTFVQRERLQTPERPVNAGASNVGPPRCSEPASGAFADETKTSYSCRTWGPEFNLLKGQPRVGSYSPPTAWRVGGDIRALRTLARILSRVSVFSSASAVSWQEDQCRTMAGASVSLVGWEAGSSGLGVLFPGVASGLSAL